MSNFLHPKFECYCTLGEEIRNCNVNDNHDAESKMSLKTFSKFFTFILCLRRTFCFASSPSPSHQFPIEKDDDQSGTKQDHQSTPIRIVSFNKYGGARKSFDLVLDKDLSYRDSGSMRSRINNPRSVVTAISGKILPALRTTFLPAGFPEGTPHGYLQFCVWSWIQDVSTQLRSVLATQKILEGVGVGRQGATALSALFNYLVRDGCGMAASKFVKFCSNI